MLPIVRLQKADWGSARIFWCPVGSLIGIGGIPVIVYQTWACAIGRLASGLWATKLVGAGIIGVLVVLWLNCLLILVSEVWDALALLKQWAGGTLAAAPAMRSEDPLGAAIHAYEKDAEATALVDARWKLVKGFVWANERPLILFYGLAICAVVFWLIPRCTGLCPDAERLGDADWCFGVYLKVGPMGILALALGSTIARNEYPRPFRRIFHDYNRILEMLRQRQERTASAS
jgi:hypothetical protein